MSQSIERLHLTVDGVTHALSPLETVEALKDVVLAAAQAGGGFLDVTVDGGERLSIYITLTSSITIAAATVGMDTGNADGEAPTWSPASGGNLFDGDAPWDVI